MREILGTILALCLLAVNVCADEPCRVGVDDIWVHAGDTLTDLFGQDWNVVFDANDFPALVRKGSPVRSPDLVPVGMRLQLPGGVHLSHVARERLARYRLQLRKANEAIADCESKLESVQDGADQVSCEEARRLLREAKRVLWEDRFDFENFEEATLLAERASLTLQESREPSSAAKRWPLPVWAVAIGIGVLVVVYLLSGIARSKRQVRDSTKVLPGEGKKARDWGNVLEGVHERSRVRQLTENSIVISTSHGAGCRIPIRRGRKTRIKVGSTPDCHVNWPELNRQEFWILVDGDGDCVKVKNGGDTRLDLGDVVLPPSRSLDLYLPSDLSLNGSTMRISRVARVFRDDLAHRTKEALK